MLVLAACGSSGNSAKPPRPERLPRSLSFKDGRLTLDLAPRDVPIAVAGEANGGLVVVELAGGNSGKTNQATLLVGLQASGHPDPNVGNQGVAIIRDYGTESVAARDPDGRLIVAGKATVTGMTQPGMAVAAYLPNGRVDTSFSYSAGVRPASDVVEFAVGADGQHRVVMLIGYGERGRTQSLVLSRRKATGLADTTFGGAGEKRLPPSFSSRSFAVRDDGAIAVAGSPQSVAADSPVAVYTPDGDLDGAFGQAGIASVRGTPASNVIFQQDRVVLVAQRYRPPVPGSRERPGLDGPPRLVALSATGAPDDTFGTSGSTELPPVPARSNISLLAQPDGHLVVVAPSTSDPNGVTITRLTATGQLDTQSPGGGHLTASFGKQKAKFEPARFVSAALTDGGRTLIVVGRVNDNNGGHEDEPARQIDTAVLRVPL